MPSVFRSFSASTFLAVWVLVLHLLFTPFFGLSHVHAHALINQDEDPQILPNVSQVGLTKDHQRRDHNPNLTRALHVKRAHEESPPAWSPVDLKVLAVGDLHGDIDGAIEVQRMTGLTDDDGNWSGHYKYLVQTGDIIDRGDDIIEVFELMNVMRDQASEVGGAVLSCLGNHEYMNLQWDWRYVTEKDIETFGSKEKRWNALTVGEIGLSWEEEYHAAIRLPLHPSLGPPNTDYDGKKTSPFSHAALAFLHGGLSPTYADITPFPSNINNIGSTALKKLQHMEHNSLDEKEKNFLGVNGPLWYRGLIEDEETPEFCAQVAAMLEKIGVRRLIVGHTPQFKGVLGRCDNRIICIDTGISSFFQDGILSSLSIHYTVTPKVALNGAAISPPVWIEREVLTAIYDEKQVVLVDDMREVQER